MKTAIIGVFRGYDWPQIQLWANSLNESGFCGTPILIAVDDTHPNTLKILAERGITVFYGEKTHGRHIVVERFRILWRLLRNLIDAEQVIITDVKDVVFQCDPSRILTNYLEKSFSVLASSEGLNYQQEQWNAANFVASYGPTLYDAHKNHEILNAGVIAGRTDVIADLCLCIWLLSLNRPVAEPDQAAYRLLLATKPWRDQTVLANDERPWATHAGVQADPKMIESCRPHLACAEPEWDGQTVRSNGKLFPIVHQYDRVPQWRRAFEQKFANSEQKYFRHTIPINIEPRDSAQDPAFA